MPASPERWQRRPSPVAGSDGRWGREACGETERKGLLRSSQEGTRRWCLAPRSHSQKLNCFPLELEDPPGEGLATRRGIHGTQYWGVGGGAEITLSRGII